MSINSFQTQLVIVEITSNLEIQNFKELLPRIQRPGSNSKPGLDLNLKKNSNMKEKSPTFM